MMSIGSSKTFNEEFVPNTRNCTAKKQFIAMYCNKILEHTKSGSQYVSYIVAVSFIGGGNLSTRKKPSTCHRSLANFITLCCFEYTSPWTGFELTTLVLIGSDCTSSCKFNYHTITTTKAPKQNQNDNITNTMVKLW